VSSKSDERGIFTAIDQPVGELERWQQHLMERQFVVKRK